MSTLFPLDIAVKVDGEPMMARIEGRVKTKTDAFTVVFSDWHSDDFYLMGGEPGTLPAVGRRFSSMKHGMALQADIDIVNQLKESQWFLHWPVEGVDICNVWLIAEKDYRDARVLYVYYEGTCKFSIMKDVVTGQWNLGTQYEGDVATNRVVLKQVLDGLRKYVQLLDTKRTEKSLELSE